MTANNGRHVPKGWNVKRIEEVAEVNPRLKKDSIPNDLHVSFVPMPAVGAGNGTIDVSRERPFSELRKGFTPFQEGDVLFAKITPCMENGKMAVVPKLKNEYGFGSTEFHVLRPKDEIDARYLYYYVSNNSFRAEAAHNMTGAVGQKRVPAAYLKDCEIPVAPPDQQKRIVAEIEKQFSRLDEAVANLKRVKANLKRYKAAVLKAAVEGKLTEEWRRAHPDVERASELLKRILAERRATWEKREGADRKKKYLEPESVNRSQLRKLPDGWVWTTVEQLNLATRPCAYGVLQPGEDLEDGIPFVRVGDINDGRVDLTKLKRISPAIAAQYPRTRLEGGEFLITLVGAIGRTALAPDSLRGANVARAVGIVPLTTSIDAKWVEAWFRNPTKIAEMTSKSHEVARKTLNLEDVRSASVALPPLREQHRIVAEIERRFSIAAEAEAQIDVNIKRAERLRQGVLYDAFRGVLLPRLVGRTFLANGWSNRKSDNR